MPRRNVIKIDIPESYYHIYARGNSRRETFLDREDYATFLNLFKRYLSKQQMISPFGAVYPHLFGKLELLSYCLMPNHFHLLVYQEKQGTMPQLMRGLMTSYSRYFNKKYQLSGSLFESRYKASMITNEAYLQHISRYIHLNPRQWRDYPYSSLPYYQGKQTAEWVQPERILRLFDSIAEYQTFVEDYEANKQILDDIKSELAE